MFRLVGINRSARNPNLCNRCNTHVEEGRVVELTVLFADLSGFTAMTRKLGPERTHAVVDAFLKAATYALVRHGAFIDKYVGDAVMAFFNAPIRYEDHAARAVAAALEIEAEMPPSPSSSASTCKPPSGSPPGYAHVGRLGSGEGKDYTAIGDVVNLAARLEGQARGGEVVVDERPTARWRTSTPSGCRSRSTSRGSASPSRPTASAPPRVPLPRRAPTRRDRRAAAASRPEPGRRPVRRARRALRGSGPGRPAGDRPGSGAAFAALGTHVLSFLDADPIRIPLMTLAMLGALANLYTVWYGHQASSEGRCRRSVRGAHPARTAAAFTVVAMACLTLALVMFELVAHAASEVAPAAGDAFTAEVSPHLHLLYRTALRMTQQEQAAEDLLQDTLERVLNFSRYEPAPTSEPGCCGS